MIISESYILQADGNTSTDRNTGKTLVSIKRAMIVKRRRSKYAKINIPNEVKKV